MEIIVPQEEFTAILNNAKRFVRVPTPEQPLTLGGTVRIKGDISGLIYRVATHLQPADALIKGDAKELFISIKPLTAAQKVEVKNGN